MGIVMGLLITLIFATAMFLMLVNGARFYQNIATVMEEQFKERTCLNYIVANVRHYDSAGAVTLTNFHGVDALVMEEDVEDQVFYTIIYYYDQYLYELFAPSTSEFELGDGFQLLKLDGLRFEMLTPTLMRIECSYLDRTEELLFHLSSKEIIWVEEEEEEEVIDEDGSVGEDVQLSIAFLQGWCFS